MIAFLIQYKLMRNFEIKIKCIFFYTSERRKE